MPTNDIGQRIGSAINRAKISQRKLSEDTGISQSSISRLISGDKEPKMTELILIAQATGHMIAQLTGSAVEDRLQVAARSTNGSNMDVMKRHLTYMVELSSYLDDQAIPKA